MNPEPSVPVPAATTRQTRKMTAQAVVVSVVLHVLFVLGAAYLTIIVVQSRQKMMFEGKKNPSIPAKKLEHSIRVKQMQKQVRKPQVMQRLVTEAPSKVALPQMPDMKTPDIKNMRDTPLMGARAGSLGGLGGSGGGAGRGLTGGTGYSDTKFFGENVRTRAIIICMDISPSMVNKGVVQDVTQQTVTMMEAMHPGTRFNLIVFVDGALAFAPQMVFATQENKQKALAWLQKGFDSHREGNRPGYSGSTSSEAIRLAAEMGCDTMFVLSDDPPYLKTGNMETGVEIPDHQDQILAFVRSIESNTGRPTKINPILYKPFKNERGEKAKTFYQTVARTTGGRMKVIDD
ncbi:MAG TPA: hypothetical protein P5567_01710 [Kiritimatiellia bacterium]|nr:hypothetical protein [Kiritimatiellia bacterium]HSA19477.1 hypothetical protein [Kiritimatiellia bacterium]